MGCAASAPMTDEVRHKDSQTTGVGEETSSTTGVARGGGKSVDRSVAASSSRALRGILSGRFRDYLYDAQGKKVYIDSLKGAPVGILFTAHTIPQGRQFTKLLVEVYSELQAQGKPFEVVIVSNDETEELWKSAVADTPFVTLPFNDTAVIDKIGTKFEIDEMPTFILLDREGKLVTKEGIDVVRRLGTAAWPFSAESIKGADAAKAGHDRTKGGAVNVATGQVAAAS